MSVRDVAKLTGVSVGTVSNWQRDSTGANEGSNSTDEGAVTDLLLTKAQNLLFGIDSEPNAKAKSDVAAAVDKLLGKYLALLGRVEESHVTISHEADLDEALAALLKGSASPSKGTDSGSME